MRGKITVAAALLATAGLAGAGAAIAAPTVPTATPIHFAAGATSAHVAGKVAAHGDQRYTFDARAGQRATFHLARSTSAMTWTLVGPTGPAVHDARSPRQSDFAYTLPETGRYYVDIVSSRPASYDLTLSIPAPRSGGTTAGAIVFAPGATSATVTGRRGSAAASTDYRFDARAGQRASITFTDSSPLGTWDLVAPDGSPLHNQMTSEQAHGTFTLPATGTYRLTVQSPAHSHYALTLSIPRG